jgi:hypothetical protein
MPVDTPTSTLSGIETTTPQGGLAVWGRRAFLLLLLCFILAGLLGLLGVRTSTARTEMDGWTVSVEHAAIARSGLDVPWQVTVTHPGGFGKELTLAVTGDYFDIFESQGFDPEPSDETSDGQTLYLTFQAPAGDTFVLSYDAYVQPSAQIGRDGTVAVLVDGERVAATDFRTRLLP